MRKAISLLTVIAVLFSYTNILFASGKSAKLIAKSRFFSIYGYEELNLLDLLEKLKYNYFSQPETFFYEDKTDLKSVLIKTFDSIYLEVSDSLDIHINDFHCTVQILPDKKILKIVFNKLFDQKFSEKAFYTTKNNIVYISYNDMTPGILGHEIAHAIMFYYFDTMPPVKVQEILAGYVELDLNNYLIKKL